MDHVSKYCPLSVQLQGDQIEKDKITQSWFYLGFVLKILHEVEVQKRTELGLN